MYTPFELIDTPFELINAYFKVELLDLWGNLFFTNNSRSFPKRQYPLRILPKSCKNFKIPPTNPIHWD